MTYHAQVSLAGRLRIMPAVVITGPRQAGKSTLARELSPARRSYYSLDDLDVRELVVRDSDTVLGGRQPITIYEVQRDPDLMLRVKAKIDADRRAGRFLLTGSANLLLMNRVSESLAGRASYLTLWPMSRREQQGMGSSGRWEQLLATGRSEYPESSRYGLLIHGGKTLGWILPEVLAVPWTMLI